VSRVRARVQFKGGMAPLLATKLPELSEPTRLEMITACIRAFRIGFDRPWAVSHLESLLSTRELARSSSDPVGWLAFLVLGKVELPTSATLGTFLTVTVASYLDPFIDGEVPAHQYTARSRGFFIERLQAAWARGPGAKGAPMELPREYVLAQYVTHTVTKMNAHFVTSRDHPASEHEIRRYLDRLSHGIVDAIARDFTIEDRRLGVRTPPRRARAARHSFGLPLRTQLGFAHSRAPTSWRDAPRACLHSRLRSACADACAGPLVPHATAHCKGGALAPPRALRLPKQARERARERERRRRGRAREGANEHLWLCHDA
jgi:hypothetical protein